MRTNSGWAVLGSIGSRNGGVEMQAESRGEGGFVSDPRPVRPTAASHIMGDLRQSILGLRLPPGTPLSEKDLTERYNVSRTPVREALIRLAEERLIDVFPQSGTFVSRIPLAALPEAVVIRKALELAALELLAGKGEADLGELDRLIARQQAMAGLDDRDGFHTADEAFHEAIASLAGFSGIWRVAQQAKMQIDRCRRLTLPTPGRMDSVIAEHRAITAALHRRDREAARQAMDRHLSAVLPDVVALRQQFPDYFI
jgi:GntR family transcriptional regulator, rspAB operon transcriptional repressor